MNFVDVGSDEYDPDELCQQQRKWLDNRENGLTEKMA